MNIELRSLTAKDKLIFIDGEKVGLAAKESYNGPNSLDGSKRKVVGWFAHFRWDGKTHHIGHTDKIAQIIPKIEREIARYEASKAQPIEEAEKVDRAIRRAISEAGFVQGLKDRAARGISDAKDRLHYGVTGDTEVLGKIQHKAATKELFNRWKTFVGRKVSAGNETIKSSPTLVDLATFLQTQFGIKIGYDELAKAMGGEEGSEKPAQAQEPAAEQPAAPEAPEGLKAAAQAAGRGGKAPASPEEEERKAALKAQMAKAARDDNIGESLTEETDPAKIVIDPARALSKLADVLMDNGLLTVSRDGEVTSGWRGDKEEGADSEGDGSSTASVDDLKKQGAKITDDGQYLNVRVLKAAFKEKGIDKAELDWMRKTIVRPAELSRAIQGAAGSGGDKYAAATVNFVHSILTAIQTKDVNDHSPNVTDSGITVNIQTMSEALKAANISGKQINALKSNLDDDGGDKKLVGLLMAGNEAVSRPTFAIIDAFMKATVALKKEPKKAPAK
jgi:hypothetical protein